MEWITRITASATFSTFTVFQGGYVYEFQFRPHHSGVNTGTDDPTTVLGKERKKLDPACLPLSSSKVIVGVGGSEETGHLFLVTW